MTRAGSENGHEVTADLIAEACAWLAVLHGPNRTAATEHGFSQWLKKSSGHARAFEEATAIWEETGNLPRPGLLHRSFRRRPASRTGFTWSAGIAAGVLLAVALIFSQWQAGVSTNIGEQRVLALDDGTRVILNTATRVVVSYDREARRVELKNGEALFEVAKKPGWPFIVTTGGRRIEALGTSFAVRRDSRQVAVTLIEGNVAVSPVSPRLSKLSAESSLQSEKPERSGADTVMLVPGERVIFVDAQPIKKDRPPLDTLLAWQRREVAFDDAALPDAVAEMNRYNRKPVQITSAQAANIRVTGLFRAGDSMSFARAVAEAFNLEVAEEADRIVLSGMPGELRTSLPIHP